MPRPRRVHFFFFNDTATTEIYTLSLHDALPILMPLLLPAPSATVHGGIRMQDASWPAGLPGQKTGAEKLRSRFLRSEEHTSELQSHLNIVCRLLLEKKKEMKDITSTDCA